MKFIRIGNHTANMNSHTFNFLFIFGSNVNRNVFNFWSVFFFLSARMYCWPAKHTFHDAFFGLDMHNFTWSNHVVAATISDDVNQAVISDIIDIPRNFISMSFNHDFVLCFRVDDAYCSSVSVGYKFVHIRF